MNTTAPSARDICPIEGCGKQAPKDVPGPPRVPGQWFCVAHRHLQAKWKPPAASVTSATGETKMDNRVITVYGELTVPPEIEQAIITPHDHEGPNNRPLWIVWKMEIGRDGITDGPQLDSICDTERSIRYHVAMMLERQEAHKRVVYDGPSEFRFHVERVPANHNFGHTDLQSFLVFAESGLNRANMLRFRKD